MLDIYVIMFHKELTSIKRDSIKHAITRILTFHTSYYLNVEYNFSQKKEMGFFTRTTYIHVHVYAAGQNEIQVKN